MCICIHTFFGFVFLLKFGNFSAVSLSESYFIKRKSFCLHFSLSLFIQPDGKSYACCLMIMNLADKICLV